MADINSNGILDRHEKWWLLMRVVVLLWSMGFLSASYLGYTKDVDRALMASTMTAAAASFVKKAK